MNIVEFIGKARYCDHGTIIFGSNGINGGDQVLLNVRGWGRIQGLFPTLEEAEKFQDEYAEWVVQAINEKIEREGKE